MITSDRALSAARAVALVICLVAPMIAAQQPVRADGITEPAVALVRDLAVDIWPDRDRHTDPIDRRRHLAGVIAASTDVDLLSRLVLGRHWRSLDADSRAEYRTLFSEVIIGSLAGRLDSLLRQLDGPLDEHFTVTGSLAVGKKDVIVRSKVIAADGQTLSVDWRLRQIDDRPAIIDLVVEGVSLLVSQRAEFAAVIEREQISGLINSLRRKARAAGS